MVADGWQAYQRCRAKLLFQSSPSHTFTWPLAVSSLPYNVHNVEGLGLGLGLELGLEFKSLMVYLDVPPILPHHQPTQKDVEPQTFGGYSVMGLGGGERCCCQGDDSFQSIYKHAWYARIFIPELSFKGRGGGGGKGDNQAGLHNSNTCTCN